MSLFLQSKCTYCIEGLWIRTSMSHIREYLEDRTETRELGIQEPAHCVLLSTSTTNNVRHEHKDRTNPTDSFER